jgi:hypothetical protein
MSRLTIDTGTPGNPATGDSLRGAFTKVNNNFAELYAELGGDSLDVNYRVVCDDRPVRWVHVHADPVVERDRVQAIIGTVEDITDLPKRLIERLQHYFLTYKMQPGEKPTVKVQQIYGVQRARAVVEAAIADYRAAYPGLAG